MYTNNKKEFLRLVDAYLTGGRSGRQEPILQRYFVFFTKGLTVLENPYKVQIIQIHNRLKSDIDISINGQMQSKFSLHHIYLSTVVIFLLIVCAGIYFYKGSHSILKLFSLEKKTQPNLSPWSNKAVLTFTDEISAFFNNTTRRKINE